MDRDRFDALTRLFASDLPRRRVVRALAGIAAAALAPLGGAAMAGPRCRGAGAKCGRGRGNQCCTGACCAGHCCADGEACTGTRAGCCPQLRACGELCCPPGNAGCSEHTLPDGTVAVGCLCGPGTRWVPTTNECVPCPVACTSDAECCEGTCWQGACRACTKPGDSCSTDADCCEDGDHCVEGRCVLCSLLGGACRTVADCCSIYFHLADGWCVDGICRCCHLHYGHADSIGDLPIDPSPSACCEPPAVAYLCCGDQSCLWACGAPPAPPDDCLNHGILNSPACPPGTSTVTCDVPGCCPPGIIC
jgi:hypothetical protein